MSGLLRRGWPVFLATVVGNAVVQALTTVPRATPSPSAGFLGLAAVSLVALILSVALCIATLRRGVAGGRGPWWRWTDGAAAVAAMLAVALAALASSWLVPVALVIVLIVLAGIVVGRGAAGFVAFRRAPTRSVLLTLVTLVAVGLLWLGALLLGFFVTGWLSAGATWLVFGAVGVVLLCAWTALAARAVR